MYQRIDHFNQRIEGFGAESHLAVVDYRSAWRVRTGRPMRLLRPSVVFP
jgi:hypothetical protein